MPQDSGASELERIVSRALLWLELLTLSVGVLHFAFATSAVQHPLIAAAALAALAASAVIVRAAPAFYRVPRRQHQAEISALIVCITLLAAATGALRSALAPLYLVPLACVALAFARWWLVLLTAALIAACVFGLGLITPGVEIRSPQFGVQILSALAPGAAVALVLAALVERMRSAAQRIHALASTDAVTGLLNLRAFEDVLRQEHRKAERFGRAYTILVIDVDNLAQVNELLGHDAGNQILGAVASAISRSIRASDVAARLGGDEFVVLLVETGAEKGAVIAQRIRNNVYASTVCVANRLVRANVSVGAATYPQDHLYPKELMILADQRMQQDRELRRPPAA